MRPGPRLLPARPAPPARPARASCPSLGPGRRATRRGGRGRTGDPAAWRPTPARPAPSRRHGRARPPEDPLLSITYTSSASRPFSDGDLATLLMNSRATNRRHGLTGLLLHRDGRFLQVLEGETDAVRQRYALIAADPRHGELVRVAEEDLAERRFPDWSMAYEPLVDTAAADIPGYRDLLAVPVPALAQGDRERAVHELLAWAGARQGRTATV